MLVTNVGDKNEEYGSLYDKFFILITNFFDLIHHDGYKHPENVTNISHFVTNIMLSTIL